MKGAWLLPGNDAVCLVAVPSRGGAMRAASSCVTDAGDAVRGLVGVTGGFDGLTGRLSRVYGAMPDGVRSVRVLGRGRRLIRTVAVRGNGFTAVVPGARTLTWVVDGRRQSVGVATPR